MNPNIKNFFKKLENYEKLEHEKKSQKIILKRRKNFFLER